MEAAVNIAEAPRLLLLALGAAVVPEGGSSRAGPGSGGDSEDLARRAGQGDQRAFEQIFDAHVDRVHGWLTRLVGPVPQREDLVQEVFFAVFRGLPRFRGEARFTTWLHRVVVNIACSHLRRRQRTPATFQLEDLPLAGEGQTPEQLTRQRQQVQQVLELLDRLTPPKRVAYILRVVQGLSLVEIGRIVEAEPATVGQRIKHARRELDQLLERQQRRQASGRSG